MSDIYFTSNPSDYDKLEGLYVTERKPPGFVRGVDLSTVGFAGTCVRGPTTPQTIGSSGEFERMYGQRNYGSVQGSGALVGNVWAALLNKPFGSIVVRRVAAAGATAASHSFSDSVPTVICTISASSVGAWGLEVTAAIEAATDGNAQHFNVRAKYHGGEELYQNIDLSGTNDNSALVVGTDPSRLITITKVAPGRPISVTDTPLATGGSDGAVAATDYTAGLSDLAVYPGVGIVLIPEITPTPATVQAEIVTLAPTVDDRLFLTWSMVHGQTPTQEVASWMSAITTQSDRIVWCYNSPYTLDPQTGATFQQAPHIWMAAILSQIDVDIHPGSFQTEAMLAGITALTNTSLSRSDLITLKGSGICSLEQLSSGFQFRSGITTNLNPGYTEITRRRMADFLQLSAANFLRTYVKGKSTPEIRAQMAGALAAFSNGLRKQGRIIEDFEIDQDSVNSDASRAAGEEHLLWRVKLISHMLALVLETEISTGTVIAKAA